MPGGARRAPRGATCPSPSTALSHLHTIALVGIDGATDCYCCRDDCRLVAPIVDADRAWSPASIGVRPETTKHVGGRWLECRPPVSSTQNLAMTQPETYSFEDGAESRTRGCRCSSTTRSRAPPRASAGSCSPATVARRLGERDLPVPPLPLHCARGARHRAGSAAVVLGGLRGRRFEVVRGDVLVPPAGTGHCNVGSSEDLLVVGAYLNGMRCDLRRGDPAERDEVLANIAGVPLPDADPAHGSGGPLGEIWRAPR